MVMVTELICVAAQAVSGNTQIHKVMQIAIYMRILCCAYLVEALFLMIIVAVVTPKTRISGKAIQSHAKLLLS